ncbi:MAG TPA: alpha/beta fold hydrolase [Burkholderiales bacterium]|nr:alpha/beta fold hydrolase [Burkholderiales bacterium]
MQDERRTAPAAVVVVHGLWMTGAVFALQRARLARLGYRVSAFSYPSMRLGLDEIASRLARFIALLNVPRAHLVGHSLGGLVVLNMLALNLHVPAGRIVLLGTPVAGSSAAQRMAGHAGGRALIGQALLDWRPERGAAAVARFEVGMIAGTVRFGVGSLFVRLAVPNDGVVCVDETRMPGLRDHLTIALSHSGMILSARVARQICSFLELGHFARS